MNKIVRFFQRTQRQLLLIAAFGTTAFVFQAPLKFILFESQSDAYLNDPELVRRREETEQRRELIRTKSAEIKACQDPVEKAKLKKELEQIHVNRLRQMQREGFAR